MNDMAQMTEEKRGPGRPPKVEMFPVDLVKNYRPVSAYEVEEVTKLKDDEELREWRKPVIVEKDHRGNKLRPQKVMAGTRIRLDKDEARRMIKLGIAERGDAI